MSDASQIPRMACFFLLAGAGQRLGGAAVGAGAVGAAVDVAAGSGAVAVGPGRGRRITGSGGAGAEPSALLVVASARNHSATRSAVPSATMIATPIARRRTTPRRGESRRKDTSMLPPEGVKVRSGSDSGIGTTCREVV